MNPDPIHMRIKSHPENLKDIRKVIKDITSKTGFSREDSGSIILAVDEACSNIIKHSYQNDHNRVIEITINVAPGFLTIFIVDDGIRFDINLIQSRDITQIKPGGLGIYIIEQIMDEVEYCRTPDKKNRLKLVKKLTD